MAFGLTVAEWEASHERAPGLTEPSMWGPLLAPDVPKYVVSCCEDRVLYYIVVLPKGATLDDLRTAAARELPADADRRDLRELNACHVQDWDSPGLDAVTGRDQRVVATYILEDSENPDGGHPYFALSTVATDTPDAC